MKSKKAFIYQLFLHFFHSETKFVSETELPVSSNKKDVSNINLLHLTYNISFIYSLHITFTGLHGFLLSADYKENIWRIYDKPSGLRLAIHLMGVLNRKYPAGP